jgi:ribonuclease-3 family protein
MLLDSRGLSSLADRSIRTLSWLGDVEYEREVRWRIARRGDFPTKRLDAVRSEMVRAEAQAEMLAAIEAELFDDERSVVRRARNARPTQSSRAQRGARVYRAASGLEALVAHWVVHDTWARFEAVVAPRLDRAIDEAGLARAIVTPAMRVVEPAIDIPSRKLGEFLHLNSPAES